MIALSHKASRLLESLRANVESRAGDWGTVYLDNARPADFTPRQFAWHLSALSKAGLYRVQVKLTETKPEPAVLPSGSVECPHCHWGFSPAVLNQHIREKH